jgi:hypothetical protein
VRSLRRAACDLASQRHDRGAYPFLGGSDDAQTVAPRVDTRWESGSRGACGGSGH